MAGECGGRSESRCMTPFLFTSINYATCLKPFVRLPKEESARNRAGSSIDMLEDRLETKNWADAHVHAGNIITARTCRPIFSNKEESLCSTRVSPTLIKHVAVGKSRYLGHTIFFRTIFPLEGLVLGSLRRTPGIGLSPTAIGSINYFRIAQEKQLVGSCGDGGVLCLSINVVRELSDSLHLGLEV